MPYNSMPLPSELPKIAKGVVFKRTPPQAAPGPLVDFLNDAKRILDAAYGGRTGLPDQRPLEGVTTFAMADWLGRRNWQIEFSATNSLPREVGSQEFPEGLPDGGMIESLKQFADAISAVNDLLGTQLMGGLATNFENHVWSSVPGAAGEDGQPRGIKVVLNVATKLGIGFDPATGKGYWEV